MSYPPYPGQGYGGAAPSYPPYPNTQPPSQAPYPSHSQMPQPGGYPSSLPYPPGPPAQASASYPYAYSAPGPNPYPQGNQHAHGPYPPAPAAYPPFASHYPPAPSTYQGPGTSTSVHASPYAPSPQVPNMYPSMPGAPSPHGLPVQKGNPTVQPVQPFDPRNDAQLLRTAMKGLGTDEKAIINILARRSNSQRQEIALHFKTAFGKDLISDLKSELTGKFEDLVVAMMKPYYEFMAQEIHDAVAGLGTDEDTVIEIICSATNADIHALKSVYQHNYRNSLESDLKGDTSGNFRRLLVSMCVGKRNENYNVDPQAAHADAQNLYQAGEKRFGTDESAFNAVICERSYPQLQAVMQEYVKVTGHSLQTAIQKEFSGNIEKGLLAILKCVENRPAYFAERLYKSMKGLGTNDRDLIRLVVSRCEIDMADIKRAFEMKYSKTLASFITGDTSGYYKKCLLALIGEY